MPGIAVTREQFHAAAGDIALSLKDAFDRAAAFKAWLDQTPNEDIEALGVSAADVAVVKSAYGLVGELAAIKDGAAQVGGGKDYTVFLRRLWGFGRK